MNDMKVLKKPPKEELTYLAKAWEQIISLIEYPTQKFAIITLHLLVEAYMRGQGKRMGNSSGLQKHGWERASLMARITQRVAEDEAKEVWFPTLRRLGITDMEHAYQVTRSALEKFT